MILFVCACKYIINNNVVFNFVDSINNFHPDDHIFIKDSISDDLSYMDRLLEKNKNITFGFNNKHYVDGALLSAFEQFPKYDYYCILHDSSKLVENISSFQNNEITCVSWFNDQDEYKWSKEKFTETEYIYMDGIIEGIFGGMFMISNHMLSKVYKKTNKVFLPENKRQLEAMERAWGMIFTQEGYPPSKFNMCGHLGDGLNGRSPISKINLLRE